jgi:hypothetical protein
MSSVQIILGFPDAFAKSSPRKISCQLIGNLPEHQQIFIFDLFYAKTLHQLSESQATALREDLDAWAVQFSSKVFLPMEKIVQSGLDRIDATLTLVVPEIQYDAAQITLEAECPDNDWAVLKNIQKSADASEAMQADAVKGLAQYFFIDNKLFRRELAIHILAMRKYYQEGLPASVPESMLEAPLYALHKAMAYFQSVERGDEDKFFH